MKQIFEKIHRYKEQDFEEGKPFEFTLDGKRKEDNDCNNLYYEFNTSLCYVHAI